MTNEVPLSDIIFMLIEIYYKIDFSRICSGKQKRVLLPLEEMLMNHLSESFLRMHKAII